MTDQNCGKRAVKPWNYRKCRSTGVCGYGNDQGSAGGHQRSRLQTDSAGKIRKAFGYCEYGGIPGIRKGGLYYRTGHQCGWRNEHVGG